MQVASFSIRWPTIICKYSSVCLILRIILLLDYFRQFDLLSYSECFSPQSAVYFSRIVLNSRSGINISSRLGSSLFDRIVTFKSHHQNRQTSEFVSPRGSIAANEITMGIFRCTLQYSPASSILASQLQNCHRAFVTAKRVEQFEQYYSHAQILDRYELLCCNSMSIQGFPLPLFQPMFILSVPKLEPDIFFAPCNKQSPEISELPSIESLDDLSHVIRNVLSSSHTRRQPQRSTLFTLPWNLSAPRLEFAATTSPLIFQLLPGKLSGAALEELVESRECVLCTRKSPAGRCGLRNQVPLLAPKRHRATSEAHASCTHSGECFILLHAEDFAPQPRRSALGLQTLDVIRLSILPGSDPGWRLHHSWSQSAECVGAGSFTCVLIRSYEATAEGSGPEGVARVCLMASDSHAQSRMVNWSYTSPPVCFNVSINRSQVAKELLPTIGKPEVSLVSLNASGRPELFANLSWTDATGCGTLLSSNFVIRYIIERAPGYLDSIISPVQHTCRDSGRWTHLFSTSDLHVPLNASGWQEEQLTTYRFQIQACADGMNYSSYLSDALVIVSSLHKQGSLILTSWASQVLTIDVFSGNSADLRTHHEQLSHPVSPGSTAIDYRNSVLFSLISEPQDHQQGLSVDLLTVPLWHRGGSTVTKLSISGLALWNIQHDPSSSALIAVSVLDGQHAIISLNLSRSYENQAEQLTTLCNLSFPVYFAVSALNSRNRFYFILNAESGAIKIFALNEMVLLDTEQALSSGQQIFGLGTDEDHSVLYGLISTWPFEASVYMLTASFSKDGFERTRIVQTSLYGKRWHTS